MSPDLGGDSASSADPAEPAAERTAAEPTAATTAAVVAGVPETPARPAGDLDSGSVTRVLAAGAQTVVIDYWTTDDATTWTATGDKTIQLASHVEGGDGETEVLVTRFVVTADDGTTRTVAVEDRGEFALMPPFSYSTAFTVPESAASADAVTLYVQFDLLVETEPGSSRYYRQTVLDTLELPLLQEVSQ
ncbi:hypothetical protein [Trujillonella endophytica]|nr:hypothetical protein [Trujillella endophytica]